MKVALSFALAIALAIGAPAASCADNPRAPNRFASTLVPSERFEVGVLQVERHGQGARPLVLVPGLASGAWVWQDIVREFSSDHAVYVVTLPGFDGRPAVEGDALAAAANALQELIVSRKLDQPVLIGHSLGGTLALEVAEQQPDLVKGVVTIDGLPVVPGSEGVPPSRRAIDASEMKANAAPVSAEVFKEQQEQYLREVGLLDMGKAADLAALTARSDPAAVLRYTAEAFALDLRPGLANIKGPVLLVAPYFGPDASQEGQSLEGKVEYYRELMKGAQNLDLVAISPSRHFVMIDQPQQLVEAIRRYLESL
ncbi:alpha/beta fold hydrolase [Massilia horti]|uniref:Alpha/beta hydrolase n=1 Tax=Massilia horti TaxID=2562153 RepID=A0A4Y9SQP3_9BURK|nr:alpha/beta hydrolase [Massilia horti]TFW28901.1 alpha/beta hydrolase [Massilia horti]